MRLVVAGLLVASRRPLAEAARRETRGGDQAQVCHARGEPARQVRGDGGAEGEAGEPKRSIARKHLDEELVHQIEVRRARHLARDRRRRAVGRVIQRVYGEARRERLDVPYPVLPGSHPAVKEHDIRSAAGPVHRHARREVAAQRAVK